MNSRRSAHSRRSPLWGPPGSEGSSVIPFPLYHVSCTLSAQSQDSSVSGSRETVSGILELLPESSQDLGGPQNHSEKSFNFKPVSTAQRSGKLVPRRPKSMQKCTQESSEIQFLLMLIFAVPLANACFYNPRHPDSDPKSTRKKNLETSMNKHTFFGPSYFKNSRNGVPRSSKINENPSMDLKVSFVVLPSVPRSSQGPPGRESQATEYAK